MTDDDLLELAIRVIQAMIGEARGSMPDMRSVSKEEAVIAGSYLLTILRERKASGQRASWRDRRGV